MDDIDCEVEKCQAKEEDAEALRHICQYCLKNKKSKQPEKDYSASVREGGY